MNETQYPHRIAYILIGPPTSGKTSQAIEIEEKLNLIRIRGADIVPDESQNREESRELVEDENFIPKFREKLAFLSKSRSGVVFDNIPRTEKQAKEIVNWANINNITLQVIVLDLTESEVVERAKQRIVCPACGESYHPILRPPNSKLVCDKDGSQLEPRPGDSDQILRKGYRKYKSEESKLLGILGKAANVFDVSARGTVIETADRIWKNLPLNDS